MDPKEHKAIVRLQSVVRAFLAAKHTRQKVKKFVFRTKVAMEIESTERNYLRDMELVLSHFYEPTKTIFSEAESKSIFLNIRELVGLHTKLNAAIKAERVDWNFRSTIAAAFIPLLGEFKIYQKYIDNYAASSALLKEKVGSSKELAELFNKQSHTPACQMRTLEDFLIMPVQRLPRYLLLLKELAKHTPPGHPDEPNIKMVSAKIAEVLDFLNDSRKKVDHLEKVTEIMQKVTDIDQSLIIERRLVFDGPIVRFGAKEEHKSTTQLPAVPKHESSTKLDAKPAVDQQGSVGKSQGKSMASLWNLIGKEEIYVYLFEDMMLTAKKIQKTTDPRYLFINKLMAYKYSVMNIVPLFGEKCASAVKDQDCSFRLEFDATHVYICPSKQARDLWVTKINNRLKQEK